MICVAFWALLKIMRHFNLYKISFYIPQYFENFLIWGKIRQMYPPKNFLSPISLKVREIIVLVNLF